LKFANTYICLLVLISSILQSQDKPGPTARFSFNNQNIDEISDRKTGSRNIQFTEDRFGNSNYAIRLFGNEESYINLGNYPALKPKTGSISLWVKMEGVIYAGKGITCNPILVTKNSNRDDFNEAYAIYYAFERERIEGDLSNDSLKQINMQSLEKFLQFRWYHIVMTYDFNHASFYVDGRLQASYGKGFENYFQPTDSVIIGVVANKKNRRVFRGVVDDVAFYDRVLSVAEVSELYKAPNPNKNKIILDWVCLILLCLLAIGIIYLIVRRHFVRKLEKEKQELKLINKQLATELKVNRALMNPHFIFNSLNTLQNFILKNENDNAYSYLVKFSKLVRKTLEGNMSDTISLEMEIDILRRYLEIENLRFEEDINYSIHVDPAVIPSVVHIPVMMLQPFVENAIWHGLLKKQGEKLLEITFSMEQDRYLLCMISDNGIGRSRERVKAPKKKSLATVFVLQRIHLLNKIHNLDCSLIIEDKPDQEGTLVRITLPVFKKTQHDATLYNN
jgi:two-component sensor histidine kinase